MPFDHRFRSVLFALTAVLAVAFAVPPGASASTPGLLPQTVVTAEVDEPDPLPAANEEGVDPVEPVAGAPVSPDVPDTSMESEPVPPPADLPEAAEVELPVDEEPPAAPDDSEAGSLDKQLDDDLPLAVWIPADVPDGRGSGYPSAPGWQERADRAPSLGRASADDPVAVPADVSVQVLEPTQVGQLGGIGLGFVLTRADGVTTPGYVVVDAIYDLFRHSAGGNLASRLRLVQLPVCALDVPLDPACLLAGEPIEAMNNVDAGFLRATVEVAGASPSGGGSLYIIQSTTSGSSGTYSAAPLSPSGSWTAGLGSGDFTWSEPLPTVPLPQGGAGEGPVLSYSSGSVDGRTTTSNPQASWVGMGWELTTGHIDQTFRSCPHAGKPGYTADLCEWDAAGRYTITLNGRTSKLVSIGSNQWRLWDDPGWKVLRVASAGQDAWQVLTPDGSKYNFGWSNSRTNSLWTIPTPDPSHSTFRDVPWRWNLDYSIDRSANMSVYYYDVETNNYQSAEGSVLSYDSGGYLNRIEFGRTENDAESPDTEWARMKFLRSNNRCTDKWAETPQDCPPMTAANASHFPDIPVDKICTSPSACSERGPAFFLRQALGSVTTEVRTPSGWKQSDTRTFEYRFPELNGLDPHLWLQTVTTSGIGDASTAIALPALKFGGEKLEGRADGLSSPMYRLDTITQPTGGSLHILYNAPDDCTVKDSSSNNVSRCFPQYSTNDGGPPGFAWFRKYVVTKVTQRDNLTGSPDQVTAYEYSGTPEWRHDDSNFARESERSFSIWRGYGEVRVHNRNDLTNASLTDVFYLARGMYGDKLSAGGSSAASFTDDFGRRTNDYDWLAGFTFQHREYNAAEKLRVTASRPDFPRASSSDLADRDASRMVADYSTKIAIPATTGDVFTQKDTAYTSDYGLPERVTEHGDLSDATDNRCTTTAYRASSSAYVIVPWDVTVHSGGCDAAVAARTRTTYDDPTHTVPPETNTALSRGLPTEVRTYFIATEYSSVQTTYQTYGRVRTVADPRNNSTTTTYAPATGLPNSVTITNAKTHDVTTVLTPVRNLPAEATDANQHTTTLRYDALGRLASVWKPTEPVTGPPSLQYAYQVQGASPPRVATTVLQSSDVSLTSYEYFDGWGRIRETQHTAPGGVNRVVSGTRYNAQGLISAVTAPMQGMGAPGSGLVNPVVGDIPSERRTIYDVAGRVADVSTYSHNAPVAADHTVTSYSGLTTTVDPAAGMTVDTVLDTYGNEKQITEHYNAETWTTTYQHDVLDNLTGVTDVGGNVTTHTYDMQSRRTASDDPDAGLFSISYDLAGNIVTTTDGAGSTTFAVFDSLNRRTSLQKDDAAGPLLAEWSYDDGGRRGLLVSSTAYSGSAQYKQKNLTYDARDRLIGKTFEVPAAAGAQLAGDYSFGYAYDAADHQISATYPAAAGLNAETVVRKFSEYGYEVSAKGSVTYNSVTNYRGDGTLSGRDYGGAGNLERRYNYEEPTGRLDYLKTTLNGVVIQDTDITRDAVGNVTGLITDGSANPNECFTFDAANRLSAAATRTNAGCTGPVTTSGTGYQQSFSYDKLDNITAVNSNPYAYLASGAGVDRPHAPITVGPTTGTPQAYLALSYDDAGRLIERHNVASLTASTSYTWNVRGQLQKTKVTTAAGNDISTYVYDADGNRLLRQAAGTNTLYLDHTELTATATSVSGTRYYTTASDVPLGLRRSGSPWDRVILNHQGSTQYTVPNATNATANLIEYKPYGDTRSNTAALPTDRRFLSAPNDDDTDLVHLGARYYDAGLTIFLSPDPLVDTNDPTTLNAYRYAENNPTSGTDPSGLAFVEGDCNPDCGATVPAAPPPNHPGGGSSGAGGGSSGGSSCHCGGGGAGFSTSFHTRNEWSFGAAPGTTLGRGVSLPLRIFGWWWGNDASGGEGTSDAAQRDDDDLPVFIVDGARTPNIAEGTEIAFSKGAPRELNRLIGKSTNRYYATKEWRRNNPGSPLSPDEYPYASTIQGGLGAKVHGVPLYEQKRQGAALQYFYNSNNIPNGGAFRVEVRWPLDH